MTWTWHEEPEVPTIVSDLSKVKIIVKNLIGNAVKFTEQGSITVVARSWQDGLEISVADSGVGIPPAELEAIFQPFYQIDDSHTRRYQGSGMGLHIVKRLVALLGGSITVESEVGRGSIFRVWLPLQPPETTAAQA